MRNHPSAPIRYTNRPLRLAAKQQRAGIGVLRDGACKAGIHTIDDRDLEQHIDDLGVAGCQDLVPDVVVCQQLALVARPESLSAGRRPIALRDRSIEPLRPTRRCCTVASSNSRVRHFGSKPSQHQSSLGRREPKLGEPELGQLATNAEAIEREQRIPPADQHDVQPGRQSAGRTTPRTRPSPHF